MKAILLIFVLLVAYWLYRKAHKASANMNSNDKPRFDKPENMVACAYCRLRLPESEAVAVSGKFFCSDEHRRLGTA